MPKVSVVMNCLNGAKYLREAMDSVFAQTFQDWEIIFWDNCSTDESGEIARTYGKKVRCFRGKRTTPLSTARNEAFKQCQGEYIALLDVDDIWLPQKLERQLPLFEVNPEIGVVYSDTIFFDEKGDRHKLFEMVSPKRGKVFGNLLARNFISSETVIFRKKALETLRYVYDDKFIAIADHDLLLRCAFYYKFDYVNSPLSKWRMGSGGTTKPEFKFKFSKESLILLPKLCRILPNIRVSYAEEIDYFLATTYQGLAFEEWSKGNRSKAREYLLPYWKYPRSLAIYLCTWFFPSFTVFEKLKNTIVEKIRLRFRLGA